MSLVCSAVLLVSGHQKGLREENGEEIEVEGLHQGC
jgi:hypothetical protein